MFKGKPVNLRLYLSYFQYQKWSSLYTGTMVWPNLRTFLLFKNIKNHI